VGILAVLQELKQRKPTATIMINGILPRGHIPLDTSVIWQDIQWINERLECIGSLNRFGYFNASSIFLTGDKERVNETLMSDYLHPSGQGALLWAQAMSEELHKLQIRQQSAKSER